LFFSFGGCKTEVFIEREIPRLAQICEDFFKVLLVCDENTSSIADKIAGYDIPRCVLKSGEENKTWNAVETILNAAKSAALGRDGIFIGVGGGVIGDLTGFAASIYMRGCRLVLAATTLLAMVDASVGGKTGFDLSGIKNLVGSFYPAETVYMPLDVLSTLPAREKKSGMGELIKTAILDGDDFLDKLPVIADCGFPEKLPNDELLRYCIKRAVLYKGGIVSEDFKESGKRKLLNLGHTFAHALESAAGLGSISHGEAVAWGIIRSCELGYALGITPRARAKKIRSVISSFGYQCSAPFPHTDINMFLEAMKSDKKKKHGKLSFIVPDENSACLVELASESEVNVLTKIIKGEFPL
jgi:3-dehydroquinate synthase